MGPAASNTWIFQIYLKMSKLHSKIISEQSAFPERDLTHLWASWYILIHIVYTAQ